MSIPRFAPARRTAGRALVLPIALALLAAGCGGADRAGGGDASTASPPATPAGAGSAPAAEPAPAPGLAPRDPLAEVEDSINEANLYRQRQQSMETYESCMRKAKGLEQPVRTTIENACKRSSRGAPRP